MQILVTYTYVLIPGLVRRASYITTLAQVTPTLRACVCTYININVAVAVWIK